MGRGEGGKRGTGGIRNSACPGATFTVFNVALGLYQIGRRDAILLGMIGLGQGLRIERFFAS